MGAVIALLPSIISAVTSGVEAIRKIRQAAKQTGEWTDAQEAEFQDLISKLNTEPQWQPRA